MIKTISDIQNLVLQGFTHWEEEGCVSVKENDDLLIFNYTHEAQWKNEWNDFEQLSRGLIINKITGEIVAYPFRKFFNWGQIVGDEKSVPSYSSRLVHVFEKLDGSLGILYRQNGEHKIATRGSFESEQAMWATRFLQENYDLSDLDESITLLFEIIYPENRIVVNYGQREDLVLLAAFDRFSQEELPFYPTVYKIAERFGFSLPTVYNFNNPTEVLESAGKLVGVDSEGYVLLYSDGSRYKIKGDDYVFLHKVISNLSKKNVFEMWQRGQTIPDIPDEFMKEVQEWLDEFENVKYTVLQTVENIYSNADKSSKKAFALDVKDSVYSSILFTKYDGNEERVLENTYKLVQRFTEEK